MWVVTAWFSEFDRNGEKDFDFDQYYLESFQEAVDLQIRLQAENGAKHNRGGRHYYKFDLKTSVGQL